MTKQASEILKALAGPRDLQQALNKSSRRGSALVRSVIEGQRKFLRRGDSRAPSETQVTAVWGRESHFEFSSPE